MAFPVRMTGLAALVLVAALGSGPIAAQTEVDLELILAVDVSRSMDEDEQILQRKGYADALRDEQVLTAISGGLHGRIALTYVEWAGPDSRKQLVPWAVIGSAADAEGFAQALEAAPLEAWRGTSISGGLLFAAELFDSSGYKGLRRVIDVSGDGPNNMGPPVDQTRDMLVQAGIVINGLPLNLKTPGGMFNIERLDIYYEDCVIGGPGAFLVTVEDPARLKDAIRRKMVLEISGLVPPRPDRPGGLTGIIPAQYSPPRIDCMIGERLRQRMWDY